VSRISKCTAEAIAFVINSLNGDTLTVTGRLQNDRLHPRPAWHVNRRRGRRVVPLNPWDGGENQAYAGRRVMLGRWLMNKPRISRDLITGADRSAGPGYRAGVPRRRSGPGKVCLTAMAAALLACAGVPALSQSAALASSSSALKWTEQSPATSPPAQGYASMAYDAATGTVVLFGGIGDSGLGGDTWTWNGTTWTKQDPATSPPARDAASMAYDAATGIVVLFGGLGNSKTFNDTWTWNGTTWTEQDPAASPSVRSGASMAYDAATGNLVLFGGLYKNRRAVGDTWTWNGTTWTEQDPATSPPARAYAPMAYDAASGTVVLYGGVHHDGVFNSTLGVGRLDLGQAGPGDQPATPG
jgi:hypothetical protein